MNSPGRRNLQLRQPRLDGLASRPAHHLAVLHILSAPCRERGSKLYESQKLFNDPVVTSANSGQTCSARNVLCPLSRLRPPQPGPRRCAPLRRRSVSILSRRYESLPMVVIHTLHLKLKMRAIQPPRAASRPTPAPSSSSPSCTTPPPVSTAIRASLGPARRDTSWAALEVPCSACWACTVSCSRATLP